MQQNLIAKKIPEDFWKTFKYGPHRVSHIIIHKIIFWDGRVSVQKLFRTIKIRDFLMELLNMTLSNDCFRCILDWLTQRF